MTGTSFKVLVSCYRERRGEGASSLFLPSCANVVEISPSHKKKKRKKQATKDSEIITKHNYINSMRLCKF